MSITLKISEISTGIDAHKRDTITYTTFLEVNISFEVSELLIDFMHNNYEDLDYTNFDSSIFEMTGFYVRLMLEQLKITSKEHFDLDEYYRVEVY